MKTSKLTAIRYTRQQAEQLLEPFFTGGRFGTDRVPRGIDPADVSDWIVRNIKRGTEYLAWPKVWDAAQFYELTPVAAHLRAMFEKPEAGEGIGKPAMAVRVAGDVGTPDDVAWAVNHFDNALIPKVVPETFTLLIQTLPVLAPEGSPDKLAARLSTDLKRRAADKDKGEDAARAYHSLAAVEKNELTGARLVVDAKTRLAKQPPPDRRAELVRIYLKLAAISGDYIETWAARMLRKEAMEVDNVPVCDEFRRAIEAAAKKAGAPEKIPFQVTRGTQAIIYLEGTPTAREKELYEKARDGSQNFLWDDPE
jgi:hypothetical protein